MSQTIIIESNREISYQEELKSSRNGTISSGTINFPNNKWIQKIENGLQINTGDQISIEASMINTRGSPEETMEFSGADNPTNAFGLVDNQTSLHFEYFITNNQQFNIPMPLAGSKIKIAQTDATETDFGCIDLSTFTNFKLAYPYEKLETDLYSNAPFPLCRASPTRLVLMNVELDSTKVNSYRGWGIGEARIIDTYEREIPFKINEGFNTPANVGELITQQFHNRIGDADGWNNELTEGSNFNIEGGNIVQRPNNLITDQSFLAVSTSTGDIFQKRKIGQWNAKIAGESGGGSEGDNYQEVQGREVLYHNILCGNPEEYKSSTMWMTLGRNGKVKYAQQFSNPATNVEIAETFLYSGNTTLNNQAGDPVGVLGSFPCIIDKFDQVVGGNYSYPKDGTTFDVINNIAALRIKRHQLIPTNIIYNESTCDIIKSIMTLNEIPDETLMPTTPESESGNLFSTRFQFGRADDENSLGINNAKTMIPKPNTFNLPATAPEGSEGIGSNGLPNSYPTLFGTKTYAGISNGDFLGRHDIRIFTRYYDRLMNPETADFIPPLSFSLESRFTLINPKTGVRDPMIHSKELFLGVVPVFYREDKLPSPNLLGVPFCAFVPMDGVAPTAGDDIGEINVIPYPSIGEFFGKSPSFYDNILSKIATTQKRQIGAPDAQTGHFTYPTATDVSAYMSYCMIGADNPTCKFGEFGRFSFTDFHCSTRGGNGSFQKPLDKNNEQASLNIMKVNSKDTFFGQQDTAGNNQLGGVITQDPRPFPTISSQSGIALTKVSVPTSRNLENKDFMSPFQPQIFVGTLFQKLGFQIEQLLPLAGQRQIQFNRGNFNTQLGLNVDMSSKFNNMIKPFTTNAYVSGADQLGLVENDNLENMENLGCTPTLASVNTNAESDELIAIDLPQKLDYAYLVVYSNIVRNNQFYGGGNGRTKIPALGYIARNYSTGDYFYSFTTGWTYTADQDYILTDFTTEIMLPNGKPAPIEPNSSVIYKIQKAQALPPPPAQIIANNDPKDEHQKETYKADK